MGVAVITKSEVTKIVAGKTRYTVSGMRSFFTHDPAIDGQPNDGWREIVDWHWTNSDGQQFRGAIIDIFFNVAATHTLRLDVVFRDGTAATITTTIVVAAPNVTWRRYLDPAGGSDGNTGLDSSHPYATLQKVIDTWETARGTTGSAPFTGEGEVLVLAGSTVAHNSRFTFQFGPINIGVYGGSAHFTITNNLSASPDAMSLSSDGHDNTIIIGGIPDTYYNADSYNNFVYWDSCDIVFTNQQRYCGMRHHSTQFTNGSITKSGVDIGGGFVTATIIYNAEISGGERNGVFYSGRWLMLDTVSIHDTGTSPGFDNCIYQSSGALHSAAIGCTFDQGTNPVQVAGYNSSGGHYVYVGSCLAKGGLRGNFSFPGNPSPPEPGFDFVFDRLVSKDCAADGFLAQYGGRFSLRNSVSIGDTTAFTLGCFTFDDDLVHETIVGLDIVECSFSSFSMGLFAKNGASTYFTNVRLKGVAMRQKSSGTGIADHCMLQVDAADAANIDADGNCFFRVGDTHASSTFAYMNGAMRTFDYWKALLSNKNDQHSPYADPLFVDPDADLHLQVGSPCIDAVDGLGFIDDIEGTARPLGAFADIGAYEANVEEQFIYPTSIQRATIDV